MTRIAILATAFAMVVTNATAQSTTNPQDHEQHHPPGASSSGSSPSAQAAPPAAPPSTQAAPPAAGGQASSPPMGGMMQMMMQKMPEQCRAAMQNMPQNCMGMMDTMMQGGMHGGMMQGGMMQGGMQPGMGQRGPTGMNQGSAGPHVRAYSDVMDKMHRPMMEGVIDQDPDVAFAKGMIPHHQAAIDMAQIVLKFGRDDQIRKLAQDVIREQAREIAELNTWLKKHSK